MQQYIEGNNLVLCTVLVKLRYSIATIAVEYKKIVGPARTRRCMLIKIL
jgi:hypothetical protein